MRRVSQNSCQQRAKRRYNSKNKYVFPHKYFSSEATIRGTQFVYNFPPDWTNVNSAKKSISFRTARTIQKFVATFAFHAEITLKYTVEALPTDYTIKCDVFIAVNEYNSMPEIVNEVVNKINTAIVAEAAEDLADCVKLHYQISSDDDDGSKTITFVLSTDLSEGIVFNEFQLTPCDVSTYPFSSDLWTSFLNYFNQSTTPESLDFDCESNDKYCTLKFSNVWNFQDLYFHADFAGGSEHCLLARNNDFYQHPIKYPHTNNTGLFSIWVSFDGKTPVLLTNPDFVVELDFIADADDNYND